MAVFEYQGKGRPVVGRAHYPTPPEPGTVLGPNALGEWLVVLGQDGPATLLGFATTDDVAAAAARLAGEAPRSVTEHAGARRGHG